MADHGRRDFQSIRQNGLPRRKLRTTTKFARAVRYFDRIVARISTAWVDLSDEELNYLIGGVLFFFYEKNVFLGKITNVPQTIWTAFEITRSRTKSPNEAKNRFRVSIYSVGERLFFSASLDNISDKRQVPITNCV